MIWDIEEACTWFGIDIIGTSETYDGTEESLNKIDNLMLDLDIYVARHNDVNYAPTLASSIDDVLVIAQIIILNYCRSIWII